MNQDDWGRRYSCPCYIKRTECPASFEKVMELKNAGLVVYCHLLHEKAYHNTDIAEKKLEADENVFIFHNTKDADITSADFLPQLEYKAISCPRCRHIMDHALNTLQTLSTISKNTAIAICDHCKLKLQPCSKCEGAIKKFSEFKKEDNENKFTKNEVSKWLSQFRDEFKRCFSEEKVSRTKQFKDHIVYNDNILLKAQSDERIDQLCRWELASGKDKPIREMYRKAEKIIISIPSISETTNAIKHINFKFADQIKIESSRYPFGRKAKSADAKERQIWDEDQTYQPTIGKSGLNKIKGKEIDRSVDQINLSKPGASRKDHYQDDVLSNDDLQQYAHSKDNLSIKKEIKKHIERNIHETSNVETLEKEFRFTFPRNIVQTVEKNKRQKSSSDLIHDIRERISKRNEDIEGEKEELRLKKIGEEKKKQLAQKEKGMQAVENKDLDAAKRDAELILKQLEAEMLHKSHTKVKAPYTPKSLSVMKIKQSKFQTDKQYTASDLKMKDLSKLKENKLESKHTSKRGQFLNTPVPADSNLKSELHKTKDEQKDRSKQRKTEDKELKNQHKTESKPRQIKDSEPKLESKLLKTGGKQPEKVELKTGNAKTKADDKQPILETISKLIKAESKPPKAADKQLSAESKSLKAKSKAEEKTPKVEPKSPKAKSEGKAKTEVEILEIERKNAELKQPKTESKQSKRPFELIEPKPASKVHKAGSNEPNNRITLRNAVSKESSPDGDKEDRTLKLNTKDGKNSDKKAATIIEKEKKGTGAKVEIGLLNPQNNIENSDKTKKFSLIEEKPLKIEEDIIKYRKEIKLRDPNESRVPRRQLEKTSTPVVLPTPKHENPKKEREVNSVKLLDLSQKYTYLNLLKVNDVDEDQIQALLKMMTASQILIHLNKHKNIKKETCPMCVFSVLELEFESKNRNVEKIHEIIKGRHIRNAGGYIEKEPEEFAIKPLLFQINYDDKFRAEVIKAADYYPVMIRKFPSVETVKTVKNIEPVKGTKGVIRYALSDRSFIDKGWTKLPSEKVVRKMNLYRMRPSHPEFDWFKRKKNKQQLLTYDTGERLAEFDEDGRGRWFYKNQRLALQYYDAEEVNAQQRFIIFSNGEPDERGRSRPYTILATFDYLGNGIVFDHGGKIRLKFNQTEGVVLDRGIGPASHWKWHTLNDPPVLQQVMIDTQLTQKDPDIFRMGGKDQKARPDDEDMLAIEFDNFIKEKSKKITENYKPFQIKMNALKINENFSLKILDQANVYLIFRDGAINIKLNLGMLLDHKEIVDTDTAEVGEVKNNIERFPARTDSLAAMQESVAYARHFERTRTERERRLCPAQPSASADILTAAASHPLRLPLHKAFSSCTTITSLLKPRCRKPVSNFIYYNNRLC